MPPRKAAAKTEPKVEHIAKGVGCTCGWTPNMEHVISAVDQQARHLGG